MKRKILASMAVCLLLATTATATTWEGGCDIRFFGQSTLHGFEGTAACEPFTLTTADETGKNIPIRQAVVEVLVAEMDTDNKARDKKMRALFEERNHPRIQGLFADLDAEVLLRRLQAVGGAPDRLAFDLRIREVSRRVPAVIRAAATAPDKITFTLEFPLSLTSFQLQPPSVLGFIKVDDQVRVKADVVLLRHPRH